MKLPISEIVKSIPGLVGIRLEEEPKFKVVTSDGDFELREYKPMLLAQTVVEGERREALDEGFMRLAGYIFGENKQKSTLSMTTPVIQSETLSMTTPVLQSHIGSSWNMAFVLPSEITMSTAPTPNDSRVELVERPQTKIASFRYSGVNSNEAMKKAEQKLLDWVAKCGLKTKGQMQWAQYDQPFSLPFTKRNEAHIEIV